MYVNRPVTPSFLTSNARPMAAAAQVQPQPYAGGASIYTNSQATSDVFVNMKTLATNVWTWLVNFTKSAFATLKTAMNKPQS